MENTNPTTKIPSAWAHNPSIETRSELLLQRRRNSLPHSSFDLDGDGAVGAHDLFLASRFDADKDGKLNEKERSNAMLALRNGFSNNFVWGCESSGLNRSFRIVQKRGIVIIDEDFGRIRETYPIPEPGDRTLTRSQLEEMRKAEFKKESKQNEKRLNATTAIFVPVENFLCKDNYVSEPKHRTISSRKRFEKGEAREKAGLTLEARDGKNHSVEFIYKDRPQNLTFSGMRENRRKTLVGELNQSVDFSHETFYHKVENEKQYIGASGKLLKDIILDRKNEDVTHFEETFGRRTMGIHGKDLPKFEENIQQFLDGDQMARTGGASESFDNPFTLREREKEYHKLEPKSETITMKPTQIKHNDFESPTTNRINSKWTAFHSNFMPFSMRSQAIYQEHLKLIKTHAGDKKHYRFLSTNEITPPITQRLLQKNYSPLSKFKSITSTGFSAR